MKKQIVKRKRIVNNAVSCTNCNKIGHEYKQCTEPITSIGIIQLKFDYDKVKLFANLDKTKIAENNGVKIDNLSDISVFSELRKNIKFLIIQRKHTPEYIEFIRGRYKTDNVEGIFFLFQQMTKHEIKKISMYDMEQLWDDFWGDSQKKVLYDKEYQKSKQKFERLKNADETELTLEYYIKHAVPTWDEPEWGFPKGRRNKDETNKDCAVREFREESDLDVEDFVLIDNIQPLSEELIGTNGIKYRHIYYVAYAQSDKVPAINKNNVHQVTEIGNIGYYTYDDLMTMFRPYHTERKKIVTKLYTYLLEKIITESKLAKVCEKVDLKIS